MAAQNKIFEQLRIVGIGSGNVGTHLYRALAIAGLDIVQVYSRNIDSANLLAKQCGSIGVDSIKAIIPDADIYLIAIVDDAVVSIVQKLSSHISDNALIAHTTGSLSMDVLAIANNPIGVFYPLQTFDKNRRMDLHSVPFLLEASTTTAMSKLAYLATRLSQSTHQINSEQRKHIHLAAVASSNFVNHLLTTAYDYLENQSINPHLLDPLITETINKFTRKYPADTQTGPAKRGDKGTIEKHKLLLQNQPEMEHLYSVITQQILSKYQ